MNVDDLLDILSPSSSGRSGATGETQQQQQLQAVAAASSLPEYKPKYALGSRDRQDRHTLFYTSNSSAAPAQRASGGSNPSALLGSSIPSASTTAGGYGGASAMLPRYPQLSDVRLPPPSLLDEVQMQSLQLGPSAGPTLGPQEVGVRASWVVWPHS